MTDRPAGRRLRPWVSLFVAGTLSLAFALVPAVGTAQEEPVVERILRTLTLLPENDLPALVLVARALEEGPEARAALLEAPREFLANQTVSKSINLAPNAFQITALDFSIAAENPDEPWFGVADPLEGLVFEPKGIGIFYRNVGIFVQEAYEPTRGEDGGTMRTSEAAPEVQIADVLALLARLSGEAMERLRTAMKELDRLPEDSPERASFLRNPREYLLGRALTLPASTYRLIALDFSRATAVMGAVKADSIRAGLAVIPEGIGVFGTEVGIFLQLAI